MRYYLSPKLFGISGVGSFEKIAPIRLKYRLVYDFGRKYCKFRTCSFGIKIAKLYVTPPTSYINDVKLYHLVLHNAAGLVWNYQLIILLGGTIAPTG